MTSLREGHPGVLRAEQRELVGRGLALARAREEMAGQPLLRADANKFINPIVLVFDGNSSRKHQSRECTDLGIHRFQAGLERCFVVLLTLLLVFSCI